jgi:hypothetical protein
LSATAARRAARCDFSAVGPWAFTFSDTPSSQIVRRRAIVVVIVLFLLLGERHTQDAGR